METYQITDCYSQYLINNEDDAEQFLRAVGVVFKKATGTFPNCLFCSTKSRHQGT